MSVNIGTGGAAVKPGSLRILPHEAAADGDDAQYRLANCTALPGRSTSTHSVHGASAATCAAGRNTAPRRSRIPRPSCRSTRFITPDVVDLDALDQPSLCLTVARLLPKRHDPCSRRNPRQPHQERRPSLVVVRLEIDVQAFFARATELSVSASLPLSGPFPAPAWQASKCLPQARRDAGQIALGLRERRRRSR